MNIFKKTIFSVLAVLLFVGNVNATDKIKIATEGAYPPSVSYTHLTLPTKRIV